MSKEALEPIPTTTLPSVLPAGNKQDDQSMLGAQEHVAGSGLLCPLGCQWIKRWQQLWWLWQPSPLPPAALEEGGSYCCQVSEAAVVVCMQKGRRQWRQWCTCRRVGESVAASDHGRVSIRLASNAKGVTSVPGMSDLEVLLSHGFFGGCVFGGSPVSPCMRHEFLDSELSRRIYTALIH